jgi:hypothetical protein
MTTADTGMPSVDRAAFEAMLVERDGHLIWAGGRGGGKAGDYGRYRRRYAHRVALELRHGRPMPDGLICRHLCPHKLCVLHVVEGTRAENAADVAAAGTFKGERNPRSKLTIPAVATIRAQYAAGTGRQRDIAAAFGVCQSTVSLIVTGRRWGHVEAAA